MLERLGRDRDSLWECEDIVRHPEMTEADRNRIRHTIEVLRTRIA